MGFRKDSYATVWEVEPVSDTYVKGRISISKKNKQTGEYETDFSGFVSFVGTMAAKKAASLKEKDRIKLGDVDVTTWYDKDKKISYTNYKVFNFATQDEMGVASGVPAATQTTPSDDVFTPVVDDGEINEDLPF